MRTQHGRYLSVIPLLLACVIAPALAQNDETVSSVPRPRPGQPNPVYPPEALEQSVEGVVRFRAQVSEAGTVVKVLVLEVPEADLGFEAAVTAAVMQWRFEPATENGVPVAGDYTGEVKFALAGSQTQGRIFTASAADVWTAVKEVLDEYRFKFEELDGENGVAITRWRRPAPKRFPLMEFHGLPDEAAPNRFQLHLFVPPWAEPGRLYIGSMVESTSSGGGRMLSYNAGHVESWLYEQVETRLETRGRAIPKNLERRLTLVSKLSGNGNAESCLDEMRFHLPGVAGVSNPVLIPSTKIEPNYPGSGVAARQQTWVTLQATIREDGFVSDVEVLRNNSSNPKFAVSAVHTVSLWRYRPSRKGDCSVPVFFTVFAEFKLGRP